MASTLRKRRWPRPGATRFRAREFRPGNWGEGLDERFDLILCNPPYVEDGAGCMPDVANWEPRRALYAGADGLDDYRRLAPQLTSLLAPGGIACVEIGAGQEEAVSDLFAAQGFHDSVTKGPQRDRALPGSHATTEL